MPQKGEDTLLIRISHILNDRFAKDETKPVSLTDIINIIQTQKEQTYGAKAIKQALRDAYFEQLILGRQDIRLNPTWGDYKDFLETMNTFELQAGIPITKEKATASTRDPERK